jgi:hypothetical protein
MIGWWAQRHDKTRKDKTRQQQDKTRQEICSVDMMEAHEHTEYFSAKGRTNARQHDHTTQAFTTCGFSVTTHVN